MPSISEHCSVFLSLLSNYSSTVFTRVPFLIAKQKGLRSSIAFAWCNRKVPKPKYVFDQTLLTIFRLRTPTWLPFSLTGVEVVTIQGEVFSCRGQRPRLPTQRQLKSKWGLTESRWNKVMQPKYASLFCQLLSNSPRNPVSSWKGSPHGSTELRPKAQWIGDAEGNWGEPFQLRLGFWNLITSVLQMWGQFGRCFRLKSTYGPVRVPPRKGWTGRRKEACSFLDPVASLQEDNLEVVMSHAPGHPNNIRCH